MDVWVGRMLVSQYLVSMQTNMRLVASPWKEMLVLVMIVMAMGMIVLRRQAPRALDVLVSLAEVRPYAQARERRRVPEQAVGRLRPQHHGNGD